MARRSVNIFFNGKTVAESIKVANIEMRALKKTIKDSTKGSKEYRQAVNRYASLKTQIRDHKKELLGIESTYSKMKRNVKSFALASVAAFGAREIVSYGTELFKMGAEMELLTKKAQTVFGEALPAVDAAAKKNANAMGLTVSQYTDAAAAIGDLLIPMGFQRQEAADISTNLVDLSGALSEWTGGQKSAEEVTEILGKAMLGEREQLKGLGIAISESDVKNRLAEKGLQNLTGEMLQQAKAAATLELITEKSTDAQAAFAANTDTSIRKQAELRAKFQDIQENIATALIPVFKRLLVAAEPIITSFAELVIALVNGDEATAKMSGGMKILAVILGNLGKGVLFVFQGFKSLGAFLLNNFGGVIDFVGSALIGINNITVDFINKVGEMAGIDVTLQKINVEDFKQSIKDAQDALNQSDFKPPAPEADNDAALKQAARNEELKKQQDEQAKERLKKAEKTANELVKRTEKLNESIDALEKERHQNTLSEEDKKLEQIKQKYDKQIQIAKDLEAKGVQEATEQRLALERMKAQAIEDFENELVEKETEKLDEELERIAEQEAKKADAEIQAMIEKEERKKEVLDEIKSIENELNLTEEELERAGIEEKFAEMLDLAEEHGIDVTKITELKNKKLGELNQKHRSTELKRENELFQKQKDVELAKIGFLRGISSQVKAIAGENAELANAIFVFEQGLAVAEIIINLQKQLAAIRLKYAAIPGGAALSAAESTIAKISAATGVTAVLGATISKFTQKKYGGWTNATGADDGINYRAKFIGERPTGMLDYNHPVIMNTATGSILANESGREYFVNHSALQNPAVLNHVAAIDNIVRYRQFNQGGSTTPSPILPTDESNTGPSEVQIMTLQVLQQLSEKVENIYARVDNDTVIDIVEQFQDLESAAGGRLV
jgi:hypothetical protein